MFRKIVAYSLMALQLLLSPLTYGYPVLTYLGSDVGMYFSSTANEGLVTPESAETVYFHLYKGIKPSESYIKWLETTVQKVNSNFKVRMVTASVGQKVGHYRVLVGPAKRAEVADEGKALNAQGIDNFPIYFIDETIAPLPPSVLPADLQKEGAAEDQVFKYSDTLTPIARGLDGVETTTELKERVRQHIRSEAQHYAQSSANEWLSQFGTAKVDVQLDKNFNLDSSEVDFLFPFAVKRQGPDESTWFVQPGFVSNSNSYYEGRNFAHIGVGYRAKNDDSFYGLNAFYDYDTTRHHRRASVGMEYGISNVKLAGNFYYPISGWKDRHDPLSSLNTWTLEERPAKGVDLDVSGYLPDFPWLSLSANYQQFFGDRIEVSTGGDPVNDPYQLDVALNYQPFPLLTLSAGYSKEKGGEKGLTTGASFTYVFGIPFEKQIDPGEVGLSKSLDAQLFKLAERDHNIRLEYRKKNESVFTARFTQNHYEVTEGSGVSLSNWLIVSNPSEVANIHFRVTAVTDDPVGNCVEQRGQVYYFYVPAHQQQTRADSNRYQLAGTITLKNGRVVTTPTVVITVEPGEIIASLVERGSPALADGAAAIVITATVQDANGNPLSGQSVTFPTVEGVSISKVSQTTDTHGQIVAQVTSTQAGNYEIKAELNGVMKSVDVTFNANPETACLTSIVESGSPSSADGIDGIVVTATLNDAEGNPVPGQIVTFPKVAGLTIVEHARVTNIDGRVAASITSTKADKYTVIADYQGSSRSIDVVFNANPATAEIVSIIDDGSSAIADDCTPVKVTVTVKDAEGNPVPNQIVSFPPVADLTIKGFGQTSNAEGQVEVDVTSVQAGSYTVSAEYKGKTLSIEVHFISH